MGVGERRTGITYSYSGSTTISGRQYFNLGSYCIREDTVANKVFYTNGPTDNIDKVLYDYNLVVGDTIGSAATRVSSMSSTIINGVTYKIWQISDLESPDYYVIEGIGSTNGFDRPFTKIGLFASVQLTCFTNYNGHQALSQPVLSHGIIASQDDLNFDNAKTCVLGVNEVASKNTTTTLFPDPIIETSKIVFPYTISSGSIVIVNDVGQSIINATIQNKDQWVIGDKIKVPGIYVYRVTDNQKGLVFSGKFVKQ